MGLFGLTPDKKKSAPTQSESGAVFDITTEEFQERVVEGSMEVPILVDFWAPWCGPCKQLMPILESEVEAANTEVLLAKVNIDENPELAQALRIQSVPTVMAFFKGQPVTAFTGARPASEIKNLIAQLIKLARSTKPDALDIPDLLKKAQECINIGEERFAQEIYGKILTQEPGNIDACNGMVRAYISAGAIEHAEYFVANAEEAIQKNPSSAQYAAGQKGEAIDNLLDLVRRDRAWNDEAPRKELLRYFEALGFADPLSIEGRKKLSRLLFS